MAKRRRIRRKRFKVDLHMHSTCSDGECSPNELISIAKDRGMVAIAITDHDTAQAHHELTSSVDCNDLEVIPGVELTAKFENEVHVLGYFFDLEYSELKAQFERQKLVRIERIHQICKALARDDVNIDPDVVLARATGNVGRPHVARQLIEKGYVKSFHEAFERYLGRGAPAYVDVEKISAEKAINLIQDAGGVAVLAHPGVDGLSGRLATFKEMGLDGVEINHPSHNKSTTASLLAQANHLGLVPTGGSDLHRKNSPCRMGDLGTQLEALDALRAAANRYRRRNGQAEWLR